MIWVFAIYNGLSWYPITLAIISNFSDAPSLVGDGIPLLEKYMNFSELGLSPEVLNTVEQLGYETPTPVQSKTIPLLLEGRDVLGQAQTGTGKTAAFALPLLCQIDLKQRDPQALVLAPTRELAIQVAEAFQSYAKNMKGFHVLPIYGGADFQPQLRGLKRGAHVVVGTPGRVMDHLNRGTLKLKNLTNFVLDEADEMLNMGFAEDVKEILEHAPETKQTALFSATMPSSIKRIADRYLNDAAYVKIEASKTTLKSIEQKFVQVDRKHKLESLTRFLEVETFDAAIIFAKTRTGTIELTEKLQARGYSAQAINGDLQQKTREQVIKRCKDGSLDIIVATDVAARGLDVERIGLVVNYDIPHDVESYVHRIGRTGRAGRQGKALLFVSAREKRMLREIENATKSTVEQVKVPTLVELKEKRISKFADKITEAVESADFEQNKAFAEKLIASNNWHKTDLIAALIGIAQEGEESESGKDDLNSTERDRGFGGGRDGGNRGRGRRDDRRGGGGRRFGGRDGGRGRRDDRGGERGGRDSRSRDDRSGTGSRSESRNDRPRGEFKPKSRPSSDGPRKVRTPRPKR